MTKPDPTPYHNPDFDEVYVRVSEATYNEARGVAADMAETFRDSTGRSRFVGKRYASLHEHTDWEECEECPQILVWQFEIYDGTSRY